MKFSKRRAKARSAFNMGPGRGRIKYALPGMFFYGPGDLYDSPNSLRIPAGVTTIPVAVIRGYVFTKAQASFRPDWTALARKKWNQYRTRVHEAKR